MTKNSKKDNKNKIKKEETKIQKVTELKQENKAPENFKSEAKKSSWHQKIKNNWLTILVDFRQQ